MYENVPFLLESQQKEKCECARKLRKNPQKIVTRFYAIRDQCADDEISSSIFTSVSLISAYQLRLFE
jgi:hypothetical protein